MKKLCLLSLFMVLTAFLGAAPIQSYQDLVSAMRAGKKFTILVDHKQCLGYFTPSAMVLIPASENSLERVAASDLHFSDYPGYPVYEYVKYTFYSDNSAVLQMSVYNAQNYNLTGEPRVLNFTIGEGVKIHSEEVCK
jgi:hypothetical protein